MPTRVCKYKNNAWCDHDDPPNDRECLVCLNRPKNDIIEHPAHYVDGRKYEPKDVIRDRNLNYNLGCVVKYVSRAGRKDDILQDLKKARTYLGFEIEALEAEKNGGK